jgi:hypothetical protein
MRRLAVFRDGLLRDSNFFEPFEINQDALTDPLAFCFSQPTAAPEAASGESSDYPADTSTTATVIVNGSATGFISHGSDHDWFRVQLTAGHNYSIDLIGFSGGGGTIRQSILNLYDSTGALLRSADHGGIGFDPQLTVHANTTGTYYIGAGALRDWFTGGTYTIEVHDFQNSGTAFDSPPIVSARGFGVSEGWSSNNTSPRILGRVDDDPAMDIVGFGTGGTYVAFANGAGHFTEPTLRLAQFGSAASSGGWNSQDQYPRLLGDVNGDRIADIVGFGFAGTYVAIGYGDGDFRPPSLRLAQFGASPDAGSWHSDQAYPRLLSDVNGDGCADIMVWFSRYVRIVCDGWREFRRSCVGTRVFRGRGWMEQ